jgi:hypothetical protein
MNNVGLQGFEPWTSCTRGRRSTKLSHSPNYGAIISRILIAVARITERTISRESRAGRQFHRGDIGAVNGAVSRYVLAKVRTRDRMT